MKYETKWKIPLFPSKENGYFMIRIPAVLTLPDGRILVFAEGRRNSGRDEGDIDLIMKTSLDGGKTFGNMKVIVPGNGVSAGSPSPIYDRDTGKLFLLFGRTLEDGPIQYKLMRTVHVIESSDGGETWENERDITKQAKVMPDYTWHGVGPCHGIQLQNGRLIAGCYQIARSFSVYSDDHGATWQCGQMAPQGSSECCLAQLKDGRVIINTRFHDGATKDEDKKGYRGQGVSTDGGVTFEQWENRSEFADPCCQGSMLAIEHNGTETLLVVNPHCATARRNVTIHESLDAGRTWTEKYRLTDRNSGYSDITQIDDHHIGILYEAWTGEWVNDDLEAYCIEWQILEIK